MKTSTDVRISPDDDIDARVVGERVMVTLGPYFDGGLHLWFDDPEMLRQIAGAFLAVADDLEAVTAVEAAA